LFLGSGAVIHALHGEQDLRHMGGLKKSLPITYWTFLIGAMAIAGVPFLAGFFSKDEILAKTFTSGHVWLWVVGTITSFLTAVYMFRLVFMAFPRDATRARRSAWRRSWAPSARCSGGDGGSPLSSSRLGSIPGRVSRRAGGARWGESPRAISSRQVFRRPP
jgi:NADH:ubiquinone oxidoreductase subunit 5 (subunit L)/multisubunit Na+/H+ antiporter MnhA subunit